MIEITQRSQRFMPLTEKSLPRTTDQSNLRSLAARGHYPSGSADGSSLSPIGLLDMPQPLTAGANTATRAVSRPARAIARPLVVPRSAGIGPAGTREAAPRQPESSNDAGYP